MVGCCGPPAPCMSAWPLRADRAATPFTSVGGFLGGSVRVRSGRGAKGGGRRAGMCVCGWWSGDWFYLVWGLCAIIGRQPQRPLTVPMPPPASNELLPRRALPLVGTQSHALLLLAPPPPTQAGLPAPTAAPSPPMWDCPLASPTQPTSHCRWACAVDGCRCRCVCRCVCVWVGMGMVVGVVVGVWVWAWL